MPHLGTGKLSVTSLSALLQLIYSFGVIKINIPTGYFVDLGKIYERTKGMSQGK